MSIRLSVVLFHIDWGGSFGEIRMRYDKPVESPFDLSSLSEAIPPPEHLESESVASNPFFSKSGVLNVVPDVGRGGLYLIRMRPHYRLKGLLVEPDEIVVDLYANRDESITYSFYNPTRRSSFVVKGQLAEDVDGFYRKLTSYPSDPVWRHSLVIRSMASHDSSSIPNELGTYPPYMTADQIAEYLQVEVKTIRKWTSEGRIPHSKLGSIVRYRKEQIDAAIREGSLKVKPARTGKADAEGKASRKKRKKS